ncbi:MAG: hypothetical protein ACPLRW_06650 [Moorellales bacterium]
MEDRIRDAVTRYYELEFQPRGLVLRARGGGKAIFLSPIGRRLVGLRCGRDLTEEELRAEGFVRSEAEWVRLLGPPEWVEGAVWRAKYGSADRRTVAYLSAVLERAGVVGAADGLSAFDFVPQSVLREDQVVDRWRLGLWGPEVEVGRDAEDWTVQRLDVFEEDYGYTVVRFTRRPARREVETAFLVQELYLDFWMGGLEPVFRCWECGREAHWLDIQLPDGESLAACVAALRERYCGC